MAFAFVFFSELNKPNVLINQTATEPVSIDISTLSSTLIQKQLALKTYHSS
jgi:hypothetical protein